MNVTLLGTGTPTPDPYRQCSANLIRVDGDYLLIDAGRGTTIQLVRIGVNPREIGFIFITHHHFDHIGCLGDLLFGAWISGRREKIRVFGPNGTAEIVDVLLNKVYLRDIKFRLKEAEHLQDKIDDIRDIVLARDVGPGIVYESAHWKVIADYVEHGHGLGMSQEAWPCFGYRVESKGKVVTVSGDAVECERLRGLARDSDVLVQCCYLAEEEIINQDLRVLSKYVLASAVQAGRIASDAAVKRLVLTHLKPKSKEMLRAVESDVRRHYHGEVIVGEDLMSFEI